MQSADRMRNVGGRLQGEYKMQTENLREDVSIHRTNLKFYGKWPKIRFLCYFHIL